MKIILDREDLEQKLRTILNDEGFTVEGDIVWSTVDESPAAIVNVSTPSKKAREPVAPTPTAAPPVNNQKKPQGKQPQPQQKLSDIERQRKRMAEVEAKTKAEEDLYINPMSDNVVAPRGLASNEYESFPEDMKVR